MSGSLCPTRRASLTDPGAAAGGWAASPCPAPRPHRGGAGRPRAGGGSGSGDPSLPSSSDCRPCSAHAAAPSWSASPRHVARSGGAPGRRDRGWKEGRRNRGRGAAGGSSVMECAAREVSGSWGPVGGIVTGGGACPYKARSGAPNWPPPGRGWVRGSRAREENGRRAPRGVGEGGGA